MNPRTEFVLSAMRAASLRAKLVASEIDTCGVALKSGMIEVPAALDWLRDVGAMELMCMMPPQVTIGSSSTVST